MIDLESIFGEPAAPAASTLSPGPATPAAPGRPDARSVLQATLDRLNGDPLFPPDLMEALRAADARWENEPAPDMADDPQAAPKQRALDLDPPPREPQIGDRARDLYDKQAKERHATLSGRPSTKKPVKDVTPVCRGKSRDHVGAAVGVSGPQIGDRLDLGEHGQWVRVPGAWQRIDRPGPAMVGNRGPDVPQDATAAGRPTR